MDDWRSEYERKLISAEEAAKLVKSGDYVVFTMGREAFAIGLAIAARKELISVAHPDFRSELKKEARNL